MARYRTSPETKTKTRYVLLRVSSRSRNTGTYPACLSIEPVSNDQASVIPIVDSVTYGVDNPNWRYLIASGMSATTTLSGVKREHRFRKATATWQGIKGNGFTQCTYGDASGPNINMFQYAQYPTTTLSSSADSEARSALLSSYLKARSAFRGANFAAEVLDTVRMFASPCKAIFKKSFDFIADLRRLQKNLQLNGARGYSKKLGELWLGFAFGIRPLVSDARSFYDAMVTVCDKGIGTVKIQGAGTEYQSTGSVLRGGVPGFPYHEHDLHTWVERKVRYYGRIRATHPGPAGFAEHFGVSFYDVVPAVWEAIPFSFLADYFVNVNEILESMKWMSADLAWLNRSWKNSHYVVGSGIRPVSPTITNGLIVTGSGGGYSVVSERISRQPELGIPYPSWTFKIPSPSQAFNVAALMAAFQSTRHRVTSVKPRGGLPGPR